MALWLNFKKNQQVVAVGKIKVKCQDGVGVQLNSYNI